MMVTSAASFALALSGSLDTMTFLREEHRTAVVGIRDGEVCHHIAFRALFEEGYIGRILLKRDGQLAGLVRVQDVGAVALHTLLQRDVIPRRGRG